jgi:alkylation response protein AidB-like acyl-CoA dehydrogenase
VTVRWLRQYASERQREPLVHPKYVRQAIADFETQIEAMNARLRDLALDRSGVQVLERSG